MQANEQLLEEQARRARHGLDDGLKYDGNAEDSMEGRVSASRRKMPDDRTSFTAKLEIGSPAYGFYVTAGRYPDGTLGEVFIKDAGKEGSTQQGMMDGFATMFSIGIQYGAEFDMLARKFAHMRFEPMGLTNMPDVIPWAASPIDFMVRWLALHFGSAQLNADLAKIAAEMRG